jgi:hypothetical protein
MHFPVNNVERNFICQNIIKFASLEVVLPVLQPHYMPQEHDWMSWFLKDISLADN